MHSNEVKKTIVQCDFDGTITDKDVSFLLLNHFADGNWRQLLDELLNEAVVDAVKKWKYEPGLTNY